MLRLRRFSRIITTLNTHSHKNRYISYNSIANTNNTNKHYHHVDPVDIFTGKYQRDNYLSEQSIISQLKRQTKKLEFANTLSVAKPVLAKRFIQMALQSKNAYLRHILDKRDEVCERMSNLFEDANAETPELNLSADTYYLFMLVFYHLVRNDLVWKVFYLMQERGISANSNIFELLMKLSHEMKNTVMAKEVHRNMKLTRGQLPSDQQQQQQQQQQQLFVSESYWNEFIALLVEVNDPSFIKHFNEMIDSGYPLTTEIANSILLQLHPNDNINSAIETIDLFARKYPTTVDLIPLYITLSSKTKSVEDLKLILSCFSQRVVHDCETRQKEDLMTAIVHQISQSIVNSDVFTNEQQILAHTNLLFSIYETARAHDIIPSIKTLEDLVLVMGHRKQLPFMWMIYRKMRRAKLKITAPLLTQMMYSSVRANNIGSAVRVLQEVFRMKIRVKPDFFTPFFELLEGLEDKRLFTIYISLVEQRIMFPGNAEHVAILNRLFNKLKHVESEATMQYISDSVLKVANFSLL